MNKDSSSVIESPKKLSKFGKILNSIKTYLSKPSNVIVVVFAVLLTSFVLIPLLFMLYNTVLIHQGEQSLGKIGTLTLSHWKDIFFESKYDYSINLCFIFFHFFSFDSCFSGYCSCSIFIK